MKNPKHKFFAVAALSLGSIGAAKAAVVYEVAQLATSVTDSNVFSTTIYQQTIGYNGYSGKTENIILSFYLPTLGAGESFSSFTFNAHANWTSSTQQVDLYGLGTSSSYTPTGTPYYSGTNDTTSGVTKLQSSYLNPTIDGGPLPLVASGDIASYINSLYTDGTPSNTYVTIRLNQQALGVNGVDFNSIGSESIHGYSADLPSGYNATTGVIATVPGNWAVPYVSYEVIPEPSSWALAAGAAGMLVLRRRRA